MSLQINFNGVDKSTSILWETTNWEPVLNNEVDILSFSFQKFGTRTFEPVMYDEVTLYDNGVKVFGGNIIKVRKVFREVDRVIFEVTVKDYTHVMDRRLVVKKYQELPLINIVCDMLNIYINKGMRNEIATFETNEIWTGGAADTDHYRVGTQGRMLTSSGSLASMSRTIYLDLTQNSLGNSDYIDIDVYIDSVANLSACTLKIGDTTLSNYFSKNITSLITQDGYNHIHILRSDFASTGSPSWATTNKQQIEVTAVAATTVNVTFDNWQEVSANAYTRNNAEEADQIVKFISFNYEFPSKCIQQLVDLFQWHWYVDKDRDIHIFPMFGELAPYSLSDDGGKYIYNSLVVEDSVDQLRNAIYVRGGFFLDDAVTEDLRHQRDGVNKVFKLGYRYEISTITLTQAGVEKAVGTDGKEQYADNQGVYQRVSGVASLNLGDASGNVRQTMQIIADRKGRRTKFRIRLRKVGTPADNVQLQIFTDDGSNMASATNLSAVATLAGGSIGTGYVEYSFTLVESSTNSLLISKDTKYHVVLTRSGGTDGSNYYQIDVANKLYDGFSYSGTSAPVYTATAYSWYFIEVIGYEALYNIDTRALTFSTAPGASDTLSITGQPYKRVFIRQRENVSITTYGESEFKIDDATILTKEGARQRALQEILSWSQTVSEGEFRTYEPGLYPGQTIHVESALRGIDADFLINRVTARARSGSGFEYQVSLVTTRTFGILAWLQSQLLKDDKSITVDDTDQLDLLESFTESISFTDTDVSTTLNVGHPWSNDAGTTTDKLIWQADSPSDPTMIWI